MSRYSCNLLDGSTGQSDLSQLDNLQIQNVYFKNKILFVTNYLLCSEPPLGIKYLGGKALP